MKIIIVGDGKVGFAIAKQLSKEGYDITIIENKPQVLNLTMNLLKNKLEGMLIITSIVINFQK